MDTLAHLVGIFLVNFFYVGLRAFQQLNVVGGNHSLVMVTSLLMASLDVFLIASYAQNGWHLPLVLTVGIGGGLGCMFSMWLRKKLVKPQ